MLTRFGHLPVWLRVAAALACPVAAVGIYFRFTGLFDVLCRTPDELAEMMVGLRLHALPFMNLRDPIRYNFFQSMFFSQHGLGDVSFYYLASGILSMLGLPISERFLFMAGGVTNLTLAVAGGIIVARLLESAGTGWIFAMLVWVSPFYVFVSKTGWARLTWTPVLLLVLFYCEWMAMRKRGTVWPAAFCALAGFVSLTDGFVILPILGVFGLLATEGDGLGQRLRRLATDRVFLAGVLVFALGVALDLAIGLAARRRGTNLTMMAYVLFKGTGGAWMPTRGVLKAVSDSVDWYFPFHGAWMVVVIAAALAAVEGFRGRIAGFLTAWWLLAAVAIARYAAGNEATGTYPTPGATNAYNLAVPSLLLFAWLLASIADGRFALARMVPPVARGGLVVAALAVTLVLSAGQARAVAFRAPDAEISAPGYTSCRVVKAAASYVRSHGRGVPYVFHLSGDGALGHFGEFYYGLSYGGSAATQDPNHLLDFGLWHFGRRHPPQEFYRAYGVQQFDYYIDFVDKPDPLKAEAVDQLLREGAHIVCIIWDEGRPIGRILSFHDEQPIDLDYRTAARAWDRMVTARSLLLQPLAGSAYHFGYSWRTPE